MARPLRESTSHNALAMPSTAPLAVCRVILTAAAASMRLARATERDGIHLLVGLRLEAALAERREVKEVSQVVLVLELAPRTVHWATSDELTLHLCAFFEKEVVGDHLGWPVGVDERRHSIARSDLLHVGPQLLDVRAQPCD